MKDPRHTDLGQADRFVREHADRVRYVGAWAKWLTWDGARYVVDTTGRAEALAAEMARRMLTEAGEAIAATDPEDRDALRAAKADHDWAIRSRESRRIAATIHLARCAPALAIRHDQLDADPWALTVVNGTLDLRTGELRRHDPAGLATKLAPVDFDPRAKCPTWDAFIARAMGGDAELVSYVQRMSGYALTGVIREHVLGFLFGGGANGKSTYLSTMHAMLGDYAARAPRSLLFRSRGERHETELTTLFGARLVSCSEVDESATFDEALVKDLTGGDPITARRMREDHWTFVPSHKLFLAGNHKPRVRGSDDGIWRRIRLIPWTVTIPEAERDPELPARLRDELPGILAWAVRGCLDWQARGLGDPEAVRRATADYREESDPLREFADLHLVFDADARAPRKMIREAYESYCRENGAEPLGARRFAAGLRDRGVEPTNVKHHGQVMNGWRGVKLATDAERERPSLRLAVVR